jgi:hypothetical protein
MHILPALPVSGPSGKRARRPEAARLAQAAPRGGKTQRQDAAGCYAASAFCEGLPSTPSPLPPVSSSSYFNAFLLLCLLCLGPG